MKINPLTLFAIALIYIWVIFKAGTFIQFSLTGLVLLIFIYSNKLTKTIILRIKPFMFFLPVMFGMYLGLSLFLSDQNITQLVASAGFSAFRLITMIIVMATFLEMTNANLLLDAVRTAWIKTGLQWRFIEDMFQLLYLTFRFFPTLQEDIQHQMNFEKGLSIPYSEGKLAGVKRFAMKLPGLVATSYHRAENLGLAMEIRGYGKKLPRSIASPINFSVNDGTAITVVILISTVLYSLA